MRTETVSRGNYKPRHRGRVFDNLPDDRLMACPFCGEDDVMLMNSSNMKYVHCLCCRSSGPTSEDQESAVYQWNNRAKAEKLAKNFKRFI